MLAWCFCAQGGSGNCGFQYYGGTNLEWTTGLTGVKWLALDRPLYLDSNGAAAACGMCVAYYGDNPGCTTCGGNPVPSAVTYGIIADQCPEVRVPTSMPLWEMWALGGRGDARHPAFKRFLPPRPSFPHNSPS